MKKVFYFFTVLLLTGFLSQVKAQPEITFQWYLGCEGNVYTFPSTSTVLEGETAVFEGADLTGTGFELAQSFVDALIGTEFYFEPGSFPVDPSDEITINCFFANMDCGTGFFNDQFLAFNAIIVVEINGEEQSSPYWFGGSEGASQVAVIRIPDSVEWQAWMLLLGLELSDLEFMYRDENGNFFDDGINYFDNTATTGFHRVEMRHFSHVAGGDKSILTDVEEPVKGVIPSEYALDQNYPNPFNPSTTIQYALPERSFVELKVYNILGVEVASLVNSTQNPGMYSVDFDASDLTSGVYIYQLNTDKFSQSRKMLLMK